MDWLVDFGVIVVALLAFIGGFHSAMRQSRIANETLLLLFKDQSERLSQAQDRADDAAGRILKLELENVYLKTQLDDALTESAGHSANLDAVRTELEQTTMELEALRGN